MRLSIPLILYLIPASCVPLDQGDVRVPPNPVTLHVEGETGAVESVELVPPTASFTTERPYVATQVNETTLTINWFALECERDPVVSLTSVDGDRLNIHIDRGLRPPNCDLLGVVRAIKVVLKDPAMIIDRIEVTESAESFPGVESTP